MSKKVLSLQNKIKKTYAKNLIPFAIPFIVLKFGFHDFWCTFVLLNREANNEWCEYDFPKKRARK